MRVDSSTILDIDREVVKGELFLKITFTSGAEYLYQGVPANIYEAFLLAPSKGKYFHENIDGRYNYVRV